MAWQLDVAHTEIQFKVRHMMVSWVRGSFDTFSGTVNLDENNPENTTVEVKIDAAGINTRQADRDAHLRSPDFLDAEKHPYITFRSTRVLRTGQNTAKLVGDLTIRDITHEVTLDVNYAGQAPSPFGPFVTAGFSAEAKISRKEWGLTWNAGIETGGVLVGDEIIISVETELMRPVEQAEAVLQVA